MRFSLVLAFPAASQAVQLSLYCCLPIQNEEKKELVEENVAAMISATTISGCSDVAHNEHLELEVNESRQRQGDDDGDTLDNSQPC